MCIARASISHLAHTSRTPSYTLSHHVHVHTLFETLSHRIHALLTLLLFTPCFCLHPPPTGAFVGRSAELTLPPVHIPPVHTLRFTPGSCAHPLHTLFTPSTHPLYILYTPCTHPLHTLFPSTLPLHTTGALRRLVRGARGGRGGAERRAATAAGGHARTALCAAAPVLGLRAHGAASVL